MPLIREGFYVSATCDRCGLGSESYLARVLPGRQPPDVAVISEEGWHVREVGAGTVTMCPTCAQRKGISREHGTG